MSELDVPDFLRRTKGDAPKPRPARWRRMRAERPSGAKWEEAERWEITVPAGGSDPQTPNWTGDGQLASGRRRVWALVGTKWCELRDSEGYIKVPVAEWNRYTRGAVRCD